MSVAAIPGAGASGPVEPPVYRVFAALAFGATVLGGTPLGVWMLLGLYRGGGPVAPQWGLLHAHLQLFGFFGTLILGVAHHLVPRFSGRPVVRARLVPWLATLVGAAFVLRIAGTATGSPAWVLVASLLQAVAFTLFAGWLRRALDRPHLATTRRQLVLSTGWLAFAGLVETLARWPGAGLDPDPRWMRAVHVMGLYGGVVGWILGVILRAGPMFVPGWGVPDRLARLLPGLQAAGVLLAVTGEAAGSDAARGTALARLGEALALGTLAAVALLGGAARRPRAALPMLARGGPETWLFRLATLSGALAAVASAGAAWLAWHRIPASLLADALRHLVTVGFATAMAVAMAFRLIPVLKGVPLPWPRLRSVAFAALLAGLLLRSAEVLADYGWPEILPWIPLSGVLVWMALACVAANFLAAVWARVSR